MNGGNFSWRALAMAVLTVTVLLGGTVGALCLANVAYKAALYVEGHR